MPSDPGQITHDFIERHAEPKANCLGAPNGQNPDMGNLSTSGQGVRHVERRAELLLFFLLVHIGARSRNEHTRISEWFGTYPFKLTSLRLDE